MGQPDHPAPEGLLSLRPESVVADDFSLLGAAADRHDHSVILAAQGWTVFWNRTVPTGLTWDHYIGANLDKARCVVVAWSEASVESDWARDEARAGAVRENSLAFRLSRHSGCGPGGLGRWKHGTGIPATGHRHLAKAWTVPHRSIKIDSNPFFLFDAPLVLLEVIVEVVIRPMPHIFTELISNGTRV